MGFEFDNVFLFQIVQCPPPQDRAPNPNPNPNCFQDEVAGMKIKLQEGDKQLIEVAGMKKVALMKGGLEVLKASSKEIRATAEKLEQILDKTKIYVSIYNITQKEKEKEDWYQTQFPCFNIGTIRILADS